MRWFVVLMLLTLVACSTEESSHAQLPSGASGQNEQWRVVIKLPAVELPVQLYLSEDGSEAWFRNGPEKVLIPEIRQESGRTVLRFPAFNNTLVLNPVAGGYEGELTLVKRGYEQVMPLTVQPDPGYRFSSNLIAAADVTGRWEVTFTEDDGTESFAVAEFDQQGGQVTGTFLTAKGDYRYLAGEVDGNKMMLSTFDGAHAFVFTALVQADGSLDGDFWSGTKWHESWVARRNFDAVLPDAYSLTYLKEGYDRLEFSFPDLDGNPVALADEEFRGKVVLVTLAGSWCPNCADEMEFLAGVYKDKQGQGLEIITLLYEHFEDFDRAAAQGRAMAAKHDAGFKFLVAGISDKTAAGETLPMLNHVLAFPTMMYVDRQGEVRRIHTGFSGPGTGQYFEDFKTEFYNTLDALLAEEANQGP